MMAPADDSRSRDIVIAQGSYAFVRDNNSGKIKTLVGPVKYTLETQDVLMEYTKQAGFTISNGDRAIKKSKVVPEGWYALLVNPSASEKEAHPPEGVGQVPQLQIGNKIVIEGPAMFALWPGQEADVIRGHQLRSNTYLKCLVYNQEAARANADKAKIIGADGEIKKSALDMSNVTVGQIIIIRGTEVSFYMPPTGISVVKDESGNYVREAVTLEQLDYSVLLDENGKKRFERGPAVIFPTATETFMQKKGAIKFKAIELNEIQGIHIKCTATYKDEVLGREIREGEEFFITGKEYPIYFPREEHAIVTYDGKEIHYATSVPKGEGRYILSRKTGEIRMVNGPAMLLPNPVDEVIVRRVLSSQECSLWYPNNREALEFNQALLEISQASPTTRQGAGVTEGEILRGTKSASRGIAMASASLSNSLESAAQRSGVGKAYGMGAGDEMDRSATYTSPRTITLNTKFQGVPRLAIWPGHAIRVQDSMGNTRVEIGPKVVLLQYDEVLTVLAFSHGTPKTSDNPIRTPYLKISNNKVTEEFWVETKDKIRVQLRISFLVSFDPAMKDQWFEVDNYIKLMCDTLAAELSAAVKQLSIIDFHKDMLNIVRSTIFSNMGERQFDQNGMILTSMDLVNVAYSDHNISQQLIQAQQAIVLNTISLSNQTELANAEVELARINKNKTIRLGAEKKERIAAEIAALTEERTLNDELQEQALNQADNKKALVLVQEDITDLENNREVARERVVHEEEERTAQVAADRTKDLMAAEAAAIEKRFSSVSPNFVGAITYLQQQDTAGKIAAAASASSLLGGKPITELVTQVVDSITNGAPVADTLRKIGDKALGNRSQDRI